MDMVIVLEFCKWEKFHPIVLLFTHKNLKALFKFLVDTFCLSIGLRVVLLSQLLQDVEKNTALSCGTGPWLC
jgi:hypothetical protein